MSLIVRIINVMDRHLDATITEGLHPLHFILREEEWAEIKERFKHEGLASPVTGDTYKGVSVLVGEPGSDNLAALVHGAIRN